MNNGGASHRPERSNDRPAFKRDENRSRTNETPNYKAQLDALNVKMDKILELLNPTPNSTELLESILEEEVIDEAIAEVLAPVEKKTKKAAVKKEKKTVVNEEETEAKPATKKKSSPKKK